jgi:CHRD domain
MEYKGKCSMGSWRTITAVLPLACLAASTFAADGGSSGGSINFTASLTGAQENPAIASESSGTATVQFDRGFTRADVRVKVKGGIDVIAAHFHCGRPGINGPVAFGLLNPGQLTSFDNQESIRITNADFTGADCVPVVGRPVTNIAALALAMEDGLIYINLHSPTAQLGEIRGQMLESGNND